MGIKNLMKLIQKYSPKSIKLKKISKYKNKIIGIDANLMIYKMIYAVRMNGYDIMKLDKSVTHIHTLLQKIIGFKKYNIYPIFVFDNVMPDIKSHTMKQRYEVAKKIKNKYINAKTEHEREKYYYMKSDITKYEFNDIIKLIEICGYPIIYAKMEADAQLAYMLNNGFIDYILSDDMDLLVFGANSILKNFTVSDKKYIQEINLNDILNDLDITYDQFIEMSILMGCDYCSKNDSIINIRIGPMISYKLIKKYINIKNLIKNKIIKNNNLYKITYDYFIDPPINKINKINKTNKLNKLKLKNYLKKFNYDDKYINNLISIIN